MTNLNLLTIQKTSSVGYLPNKYKKDIEILNNLFYLIWET